MRPTDDHAPLGANAAVPQKVVENIEAIAALHARAEVRVGRTQRGIESLTASIGRPGSLILIAVTVLGWTLYNAVAVALSLRALDPPPFAYLQGAIGICALIVTTMVLTTQNRQAKLAAQRAHLDLQVNLLAEQKVAKLIALVEELRRDLPIVRDRVDPVAEAMTEAVDTHAVVSVIERALESTNERHEP